MTQTLVIDLETTGLPWQLPENLRHVLEFGAVLLHTDGSVILEESFLVNPGYDVLYTPVVQPALAINHLDAATIIRHGITPEEAKQRVISLFTEAHTWGIAQFATSYNRAFDFGEFLDKIWHVQTLVSAIQPAPCIMLNAAIIMRKYRMLGNVSRVSLVKAVAFCQHNGHNIRVGPPHRALSDAHMAADVMLALTKM